MAFGIMSIPTIIVKNSPPRASVLSSINGFRIMDPFYKIPEYPEHVSSTSVLTRLLDGLGFRFHWATEGLRPEDYSYRPSPDTMSVSELVGHVWGLVSWVTISTLGESRQRPEEDGSVRNEILDMIWQLREAVLSMDEGDLGRITIEGRPCARGDPSPMLSPTWVRSTPSGGSREILFPRRTFSQGILQENSSVIPILV